MADATSINKTLNTLFTLSFIFSVSIQSLVEVGERMQSGHMIYGLSRLN